MDFACVPLKIITDDAEYLDDGTLDAVGMARTLRTYKGKTSDVYKRQSLGRPRRLPKSS